MAALVQTLPPQQSSTSVTLMQPRPQSASGSLQAASQGSSGHHAQHHLTTPRNMAGYTNPPNSGNSTSGGYRTGYTTAPVAPYAFTSTPGLSNSRQQILSPPKIGERTSSAPAGRPEDLRNRYPAPDSVSSSSSASSDPSLRHQQSHSSTSRQKEDASSQGTGRANIGPLSIASIPNLAPPAVASPTRPSPDRYRRGNRTPSSSMHTTGGSALPSGSGMAAVAAIYSQPHKASSNPSLPPNGMTGTASVRAPSIGEYTGQLRSQSVDDIHTYRHPSYTTSQQSRRRSIGPGSFTAESFQNFVRQELAASTAHATPLQLGSPPESPASGSIRSQKSEGNHKPVSSNTAFQLPIRPGSRRDDSIDSSASGSSSNPSSSHHNSLTSNSANAANFTTSNSSNGTPHEISLAHVPPRGSSTDGTKRTTAPSPLSKPVSMASDPPAAQPLPTDQVPPPAGNTEGAAKNASANVEKLAALTDLPRKGMKNRLRRAFSFGSAAELRKASAANSMRGEEAAERARLRQERYREEQEAEQARIAKLQEEGGIGEGIYNGQGNFFTGSTDNISVSSTASSASVMIRKMGKGMKRSTRSFVGLFRPKSLHGESSSSVQAAAPASTGQVSMVTVEADKRTNVDTDPREQPTGSTGFPKLDKNLTEGVPKAGDALTASMRRGSIGNENRSARRSIVGGEKERQEVLNAAKKGILKRTGSSSPVAKPVDSAPLVDFQLPPIPPMNPTTETAENQRPRADSLKMERQDYFSFGPKFPANASSNSAPSSPNSLNKYNVSFSPRITFHETWPSGEYDRRGEIATCNRLTPMLAQQIKEELNTFKMEMDVHEESKVYTHFF